MSEVAESDFSSVGLCGLGKYEDLCVVRQMMSASGLVAKDRNRIFLPEINHWPFVSFKITITRVTPRACLPPPLPLHWLLLKSLQMATSADEYGGMLKRASFEC